VHQLLCLRLAVILCHARREPDLKGLRLRVAGRQVTLALRPEWAKAYPQSAHLLREETAAWQKTAWVLALG
jgi:exopolyphosphatase/guanosine-5'-triphosphate,3'-diphosphate pyrophosphatase